MINSELQVVCSPSATYLLDVVILLKTMELIFNGKDAIENKYNLKFLIRNLLPI